MKKSMTPLWLGFLEAGDRSSPVVRDSSMGTGNSTTIYLFNLMRGRILEYRKDIVEQKLRELLPEESSMVKTLQDAFQEARAGFIPRGSHRPLSSPTGRRNRRSESEIPEFDGEDAWQSLDYVSPSFYPPEQLD